MEVNEMKDSKKNKVTQCPICKKDSFEFDSEIEALRCYNEFCRWTNKIAPAIDVPMSFLQYCFTQAEPGPKKEKLEGIIKKTKELSVTAE